MKNVYISKTTLQNYCKTLEDSTTKLDRSLGLTESVSDDYIELVINYVKLLGLLQLTIDFNVKAQTSNSQTNSMNIRPNSPTNQPVETHLNSTKASINLPKLSRPTFDGNILQWQAFWDYFETAVHKNLASSR